LDPKIRSWFLRSALEVLEHLNDEWQAERLYAAVPKRLASLLAPERLRAASPFDTIPLGEAEDVLFALDAVVAHGAGSSMEAVAEQLVSRAIDDGVASISVGDLASTMLRLQPLFESPFVDAEVTFELSRLASGFSLVVGLRGRPRASRLLRHYAVGAVRVAARYVGESAGELRITSESQADQAIIRVRPANEASSKPPESRPKSRANSRPSGVSLELEVERILGLGGRESPSSGVVSLKDAPDEKPARARSGRS
jgi:hypothetical protein